MNQLKSLSLILLICTYLPSMAVKVKKIKPTTEIEISKSATHVAQISDDRLIIITGSTYLFTVDTPEDKGLVSTKISAKQLPMQLRSKDGSFQKYRLMDKDGMEKEDGELVNGDQLVVTAEDGKATKTYQIAIKTMAVAGHLYLQTENATINTGYDLTLYFSAGQRTPNATVQLFLPAGIEVTQDNTTVNVIGRGAVKLKDLSTQSIGRVGGAYSYSKVGSVAIGKTADGGSILTFSNLDLRPKNGPDLKLTIENVKLNKAGKYTFSGTYTTSKPEVLTSPATGAACATLTVTNPVSSFERIVNMDIQYRETPDRYTTVGFKWGVNNDIKNVEVMQSADNGQTWTTASAVIDTKKAMATVSGLLPKKLYAFKLNTKDGPNKGLSNELKFYSGKMDVKSFGVKGDGTTDDTQGINDAIESLNKMGGGTLLFSAGVYNVRTVHLKSNVYLFVDKEATIRAIKGADAPESTWFSDKKYRSGLSPTDAGPYADPENYMTKQDVGHHYFRNTMFFGERLDNIKIIGNGLITGNGNLVNGDKVMSNAPDNRADKMFTLKLCTNLEIGGIYRSEDLWYDPKRDEPYYIGKNDSKIADVSNMLRIDRAGHFVLLATGTDNINVHDTYMAKESQGNARDIYDFMGCNNVTATNIYSKVSSDDIIKPGSDCSLGFTRPARNYKVRNIIGDTNCNLFQIGSETADDIKDICVDNIYVLGANKAGFSISTNDGAHISDIHLNCGHTGKLHSRSQMYRTRAPFFISISNRARIIGASVGKYAFTENGVKHDELLVKNVNIGKVENIILNGIDIYEVYAGSSYGGKNGRWKPYEGTDDKATPIIAGYKLPDTETVIGGLNFKLPNGLHTGYIKNIVFNDVQILVKGGNPPSDTANLAPELGVGQYNVGNLKVQPSYGIWARHVNGLTIKNSSFNYEKRDSRYAIFLDDVQRANLSGLKMVRASNNPVVIKLKNSSDVVADNIIYFNDQWDKSPTKLPAIKQSEMSSSGFPKL
ncbi:MAG: glycosyl hydrolase family 28-related protein [Candidatus Pedobacter colombiensis]|uniref:Glycosyl hydrolase family 28-related protein n=1 Tax=Candidatus Pedobacter colombiensis TaxID=3121371 RepID=A0AAJ5W9L0_9SPHI|nr:glycosyl hydrolase family 28-related protein [Pedobacter sp.]WEK18852.1 MAG: glycosyl hydrolase family 28-related protein [Pedobacter sp.]